MARYLVTGAAGFIASRVMRDAAGAGAQRGWRGQPE